MASSGEVAPGTGALISTLSVCTEHFAKAAGGGLEEGRTLSQVLRNPEANKKCGTRGQQVLRREMY